MIGGYVLDPSALLAWCRQSSILVQALVWSAVQDSVVLLVPSTVLASTTAQLTDADREVLDVLLGLHVTVVDPLTADQARGAGRGEQLLDVMHTLACARGRGWPVVTAHPDAYPADVATVSL